MYNNDSDSKQLNTILNEGRKNILPDSVKEPMIEQPDKKLLRKLRDLNFGQDVMSLWRQGNAHRSEWLLRQEAFLDEYDEFINPIYSRPTEWASSTHLPIALTVAKTYHARFYAALMGDDMPLTVNARKSANVDRETVVQDLMQYGIRDWANDYAGIEDEVDKALWTWVTRGVMILKNGWERRYSQFRDVVQVEKPKLAVIPGPDGEKIAVETTELVDEEQDVTLSEFDGPTVRNVQPEDLIMIGSDDPDKADAVIESLYMTASELYTMVDRGLFDKNAVETIIKGSGDYRNNQIQDGIKLKQADKAGMASTADTSSELTRYHILECYCKKDVYGSGINSELVTWTHDGSGELLRATYLHRVNAKTKRRPYAKVDFYKRAGQIYGIGLIELIYNITKEIDALNNMAVDFGLISSMPFGYIRASASTGNVAIPIEPGALVPLDNPSQDVFFPNLGNKGGWASGQINFLYSIIERLTGLNDITYGSMSSQGAARTASGVRALVGESNTNLDIFLRRLNRGMKKVYKQMLALIQEKMPPGLEFRITGDDGAGYFRQVRTRDEIAGTYDFSLEPNSSASNPQIKMQNAQQVYQMTSNVLDIQLGIITPLQRYESVKSLLTSMGIRDFAKYIQKPPQQQRIFSPEEMANRVLAGYPVQLSPMDDLAGFITLANYIIDNDQLLGQYNQEQALMLEAKRQEAVKLMQALEAMKANTAVADQMRSNASNSMQQTAQEATPPSMSMEQPQ